ncbi:plasmid mobilization relaxosome protein MobC [filamentous cyanobacterium CCP1]|nr:plasmid mobilization relaxosome protein MobC [filamentous cyanobacterium CCP1]
MSAENNLTTAELFRAKTLKNQIPRRVTRIAGLTYWELTRISDSLSQIAKAILANATTPFGEIPIVVDQELLNQTRTLLSQVRRELVDLDFLTEIEEEP